ncbi:MAG: alpha-amylase family glycosyl hydrolase [Flavobacteriales bacterium]
MKTMIGCLTLATLIAACADTGRKEFTGKAEILGTGETRVLQHPEWSKNANIYEVNIRQHTPEGTFAAFEKDIPRLKEMGVDILWLMPVHPIGVVNRKQNENSLGSHYSVQDYVAVNPKYGSLDEFKQLVNTAHNNGMRIILDWVANHSAFDNGWTKTHPEYYLLDKEGKIQPPLGTDWTDVAQLDYNNKALWRGMTEALKYWVRECDIDGYRCDVAMKVPTEFWNEARAALDSIKPVFMLAEAEQKDHHLKAFDMSYAWEFMHISNEIAKGKKKLADIDTYIAKQDTAFPRTAYRMMFTTNHDENSWNGTGYERFGAGRQVFDVLSFTLPGMPLLYSGQEGGEQYPNGSAHRLRFFDKDTVNWNGYKLQDFYTRLLHLHHNQPAMWNGEHGGSFAKIKTSSDDLLYCFTRKKDNSEVVVLLNFSDKPQKVDFIDKMPDGDYKSIFNEQLLALFTKGSEELPAYGYQVFVKQ